jgi:hypothetical protein
MSAALIQRIAFRVLPAHLKQVLLAMANYAQADGSGCRPALATLAAWTGRSPARTKVVVRELRLRGLIVVTKRHAPHRPAEYRLRLRAIEALPSARHEPQQLTLEGFLVETGQKTHDAQGDPANGVGLRAFSTISTGIHRSPAIRKGIAHAPRSVKGSVYRDTSTSRARERTTAGR